MEREDLQTRRAQRAATRTTGNRKLPQKTKSGIDGGGVSSSSSSSNRRALPARSKTYGAERAPKRTRSKKKGIRVAILVRKRSEDDDAQNEDANDSISNIDTKFNADGTIVNTYQMQVACSGKFQQKGNWLDVNAFWQGNNTTTVGNDDPNKVRVVDKEIMCDLLADYSERQYPERRGADNLRPKRCYLRDEPMRGISYYKDYDWDPVKLTLQAVPPTHCSKTSVEILEKWTRQVTLEQIPIDFSTDLESILKEQGDKTVTSTLTKSKLHGHPLAQSMMHNDTQIVVELRGLESVVGVLGNEDDTTPHDTDAEGNRIWRDVKTLRALLYDKPFPKKEGKGTKRTVEVIGLESYIHARVHYAASFEGDVVSDHGVGLLLGERWWAHPLKDIMMGFHVENAARIYEDITLHFYSEIGYRMDNFYFDWENHSGKWVKVKKERT